MPGPANRTQGQGRPSLVAENPFEKREENISGHHPNLSITLEDPCSLSSCRNSSVTAMQRQGGWIPSLAKTCSSHISLINSVLTVFSTLDSFFVPKKGQKWARLQQRSVMLSRRLLYCRRVLQQFKPSQTLRSFSFSHRGSHPHMEINLMQYCLFSRVT